MNDFKGLSKDTSVIKTPEQMWQFARNILLTNKYLSVTNEKGNEYGYDIPGVVLGYLITNDDIVYWSKDGNFTCIGYVNQYTGVYVSVIRTLHPKFKINLNCPIEGVYVYNYKKELIVVYSDGINPNSATPKLINLHNPQVQLTPDKEFVNMDDYTMFELFNHIELPSYKISYEPGALKAEVVHISICYVYDDNTDGLFSPILTTAYPNFKGYNTVNRNVRIELDNLSSRYKKIKLAFIIKNDAGTFGYTTPILTIKDNKLIYTLSSTEDLYQITPEEIVIPSERFTKIKTMTKTADQIIVGHVEKRNTDNYQKYANKIKLNLRVLSDVELEKHLSHPSLLPDEVYSFSIIPIFKDGTKGGAFHIPGPLPNNNNEKDTMTMNDLEYLGLGYQEFFLKQYKKFHFYNTGIINANNTAKFGYWENENTYPNKPYYDSSDINGEDLRNTPIRYHRIPSLNQNTILGVNTLRKPIVRNKITDKVGYMPKFAISVSNFEDAFPIEIRNELQGYEIVFEKRERGGTYVETNGLLYTAVVPDITKPQFKIDDNGEGISSSGNIAPNDNPTDFSNSFFISNETIRDQININASVVKVYYGIKQEGTRSGKLDSDISYAVVPGVHNTTSFAAVVNSEYLLPNNIASNNRFREEQLKMTLKHKGINDPSDAFIPLIVGQTNLDVNILYASLITINKNIYNLENNNDFISMGTYIFNKENTPLLNGDVFTTNIINKTFSVKFTISTAGSDISIINYLPYYIYNLYSPFSNHYIINGNAAPSKDYVMIQMKVPTVIGSITSTSIAKFFFLYYKDYLPIHLNKLNSFDYSTIIKAKPVSNYFNDLVGALPPSLTEHYISYFPYRVHKGLAIPNESLQTRNLRFFPTNSYYDMRNDRGEIIALRGYNRGLYIQQRYSLFETVVADKLNSNEAETYLGSSELFDRIPTELMYNDNIGYIGSNSQFACIVFKDGYATVDEEQGKVFIVNSQVNEISKQNIKNYFQSILPIPNTYTKDDLLGKKTKVDNPYVSIGYLLGFDGENNRLLLTKKYYKLKDTVELEFDGEFYKDTTGRLVDFKNETYFENQSKTFSFALDSSTWVCEHDYFPNIYMYNNKGFYTIENTLNNNGKFYTQNSNNVIPGNYYGKQFEGYVDLIFNTRLDINKLYQALYWVSESFEMDTNRPLQYTTIDKVMMYTNHQCSGIIPFGGKDLKISRNTDGIWQLNEFRDLAISPDKKLIDDNGNLITSSINANKQWYERSLFIGNYIVVRMIWANQNKVLTHIHNVNVKSIISQR